MDLSGIDTLALIAAYKARPILHDANIIGYRDRKARASAWKELAAETGARPEECKAKMQSLLASFRKAKKRVSTERNAPAWRYWNALKFLRGLGDDEEDPLAAAPERDEPSHSRYDSPWSTSRMLAMKYRKTLQTNVSQTVDSSDPEDEFTDFGNEVETGLKNMTESQRRYAENLINQTLYDGLVFQLTAESKIRDDDR